MKKFKKLSALLLSGAMIMSMTATAFADETPTVGTDSVSVEKNLELAEGLTIPENMTFAFEAKKITTDAPDATINNITFADSEKTNDKLANGKYTLTKDSAITFGSFPHAGEYEYTVTETKGENTDVTYSTDSYHMRVIVGNKAGGGLEVTSITATKDDAKQSAITFTNTYAKNTGILTIKKNTVGDHADKTKKFKFGINFTSSPASTEESFTGYKDGKKEVECHVGASGADFELMDGESLVFTNLPVGTTYTVVEYGVENDRYTPSIKLTENGTVTLDNTNFSEAEDAKAVASGKEHALVGEGTNEVEFTNTFENIPITGIIVNNLPFILLIALGICALGLLVVSRKRRGVNR